jgi:hypothetical protein
MKKVTVEYRYEDYFSENENDIGVLFENGKVLVADKNGLVGIYNAYPSPNEGCVRVDLDADGTDYTSDNPEFIVDLVLSAI